MPKIPCPHCGRELQYPESLASSTVSCPGPGCGRPVELPNLDGTFPSQVAAPLPDAGAPQRAERYYLRKLLGSVVVGPMSLTRLRELVGDGKVCSEDRLSVDRKKWWPAGRVEPDLFGAAGSSCRTCGAKIKPGESEGEGECAKCARGAASSGGAANQGYAVGTASASAHRSLVAPAPIAHFASARSADAIVAASSDGWLGLFACDEDKPRRTWLFDAADDVRVAVADGGGLAVVAARFRYTTQLYVADFERRRLEENAELDGPIQQLALDADGKYVALVDNDTHLRLYRIDPWKRLDKFPVRGSRFAFCLDRERMAAADGSGSLFIWNLRKGRIERELRAGRGTAFPEAPLELSFSNTGTSVFGGSGFLAKIPAGIPLPWPTDGQAFAAGFLGLVTPVGGCLGGAIAMSAVNNAEWIAKDVQKKLWEQTCRELERVTRLRAWDVESGELTADVSDICSVHPVGIGGAYFSGRAGVAVTVGPADARAWGLGSGRPRGVIYNVTDPNDVRRAQAEIERLKPFIKHVEFTNDGEDALALLEGAKRIRVVPLPRE
jgi:hypothetical protein